MLVVNSSIEIKSEGRNVSLPLVIKIYMQTKNNIKNLSFFFFALFLGEAVLGLGLFWPILLVLNIGSLVYWLGLFVGLFLSIYYGQVLGLMSLYIILFLVISKFLFSTGRLRSVWVVFVSLIANLLFDFLFGLGVGFGEQLAVLVVSLFVARGAEGDSTIRINI